MMEFIDTHSHIFSAEFDADRVEVINAGIDKGVVTYILPAIDSQSHSSLIKCVDTMPDRLYAAMGLHPTSVNDNDKWQEELSIIEEYLASGRKFVAIGEVGLDLYWSKDFEREQTIALKRQIELSLQYDLPLIIHTRDAWSQMKRVLNEYQGSGLQGVLHGYSSCIEDYEEISQYGDFYVGIGGVVTFKKSTLVDVVKALSIDRILLETDAPYLAPHPFRGKRNIPSYIPIIAERIAQIKDISCEEVAKVTTQNAKQLFKI